MMSGVQISASALREWALASESSFRQTAKKKKVSNRQLATDNFVSLARRVGAGESKELFEAKLKKVASAKSAKPQASK